MKIGFLQKDQQERFNTKRGWFVNAWRVVDARGIDMVQPWFNTKSGARSYCRDCNIQLWEERI